MPYSSFYRVAFIAFICFAALGVIALFLGPRQHLTTSFSLRFKGQPILSVEYDPTSYSPTSVVEGNGFTKAEIQNTLVRCSDSAASEVVYFLIYDQSFRPHPDKSIEYPTTSESYLAWIYASASYSTTTLNNSEFITFRKNVADSSTFVNEYLVAFLQGNVVIEIQYPVRAPYCLSESDVSDIRSIIKSVKLRTGTSL